MMLRAYCANGISNKHRYWPVVAPALSRGQNSIVYFFVKHCPFGIFIAAQFLFLKTLFNVMNIIYPLHKVAGSRIVW